MKNDITLYNAISASQISWPSNHESDKTKDYLENLVKNGSSHAIINATTDFRLLKIDNQIIPITICDFVSKNTYLCSVYTQYIDYTIEELSVIKNNFFRKLAHVTLAGLGKILKLGKIDKCIHVNNWLFPTNIYYPLSNEQIKRITEFLSSQFPLHAILFRTLNFITDEYTLENLQKNHYFLAGSRQIHILTKEKLKEFQDRKPNDLRRDENLLRDSGYEVVNASILDQQEIARMTDLYRYLYLDKHSYLNPQFTAEFIQFLAHNPLFTIKALKKGNSVDAFIGCLTRNNITYAPLFGYDTKLPAKIGLYRMLSAIKISTAMANGATLHSSAGAGGFKRNRGHQSAPEYHAVYVKHLSYGRKVTWSLLKWVVNYVGMPLIKRYDT